MVKAVKAVCLPFLPAALNKRKKPEKWLGKSFVGWNVCALLFGKVSL
jgi:hypothetical protein